MTELEKYYLLQSIKRDIRIKRAIKASKISIVFATISCVTMITSFILMFFPAFASLPLASIPMISTIFFSVILGCSYLEINLLEKYNSYKIYCESYKVLKDRNKKIYKVKTLEGKTIFLNENMEYIGDNNQITNDNSLDVTKKELENLRKDVDNLKERVENNRNHPQDKTKNQATYYLLSDRKFAYNTAIGREKELELLEENLLMPGVNPLIIGPAGVGKTALVRGLVYKIQRGNVCNSLKNQKIGEVSAADLVSGCRYVGDFEQKMMEFINFARKEDAIFFIDEFHSLIGLGQGSNGNLDGANILKPYLSSGQLRIIGATTEEEYEKIIKADPAFERRFEVIRLKEPTGEILYNIIDEIVTVSEKYYNTKFGNNALERKAILESLVELTDKDSKHRKYDCKINNPILIKNIIMRAFAKAKINNSSVVTIQHICETLQNNPNLYESAIEETVCEISNLDGCENQEEEVKTKILNFPNNGV